MKKVIIDSIEYEDFPLFRKILKKIIFNPMLNYILPSSFLKNIIKDSKSDLGHESLKAPGNWNSMKICYENKPPKDFIDTFILTYGSFPLGLRNRKKMIVQRLSNLIKRYKSKRRILILGVGSGRALNALESIKESGFNNVEGYFIDYDKECIKPGRELAESMGLGDKVKYICAEARNAKNLIPEKADIFKLIGIIEYLTDEQVFTLLKVGFDNLNKGGTVITHSIEPTHGIDPFLKKVFNLHFYYRTPQQVEELLKKAGFKIMDISCEPLGIYHIITAVKE
ncbi:class I SAM-dependent methyltransferase family protein [bacterium]|nr:class I SAM-dependent methyltransferase family protein [bacterium]